MLDWINIIFEDFIGIDFSDNALLFWVLWPIISTLLFAMVLIILFRRNTNPVTLKDVLNDFIHKRPSVYWLFMIATVATSCVLSMVSPSMPGFQDRYHFFMLPVLSIFIADSIALCLWLVSKALKLRNRLRICLPVCIIVMIISSNVLSDNSYTNYSNDQTSPHAVLDHCDCFVVLSVDHQIHNYAELFRFAEGIYPAHGVGNKLLAEINGFSGNQAYILIQYGERYSNHTEKLIEMIEYKTTQIDSSLATVIGNISAHDVLLLVDYGSPKEAPRSEGSNIK